MSKKEIPAPLEALILTLLVFSGTIFLAVFVRSILIKLIYEESIENTVNIFYQFSRSLFIIVPFYYASKKKYYLI